MPITGRGNEVMKTRNAVAGMELSTELVVLRVESFSIIGARRSEGALIVKEPMLFAVGQYWPE